MTDLQSPSWSFGDPTGWAIACGFFLFFSLAIGWLASGLSHRLLCMGSLDHGQRVSRRTGIVIGASIAIGIFATFFFTSLSGFLQLDYRNGQLAIHYRLPSRTVVLQFIEVMNVREEPAFKGRWRLVLITDTSGTYESALVSHDEVRQAGAWIRRQMRQPSLLQP